MRQKAFKIFLLVISIAYIGIAFVSPVSAQSKQPADIGYGEPEETDFC